MPPATRRHAMRFGAEVSGQSTRFQLWAPKCAAIGLLLDGQAPRPMARDADGWHSLITDTPAGTLYQFQLPDGTRIADPASRFQPQGLHGPSQVIDPAAYDWRNPGWRGRPWEEAVIYELHPGAFTGAGTWDAAIDRLDHLAALGVTAVEVMPVAQFHGAFNWGYDGALWFAPHHAYGRPEAFKAFVDAAHDRGLMVLLDVVYNHFGPVGNVLPVLCPIFTDRHHSPWGAAINLDGPGAATVRELIVENALYWLREFALDGLRLDAVHELRDDSPTHILKLLAARVRADLPDRHIHLVLENARNEARWLRRDSRGQPLHFTAQWNDDAHHILHVAATGEKTGFLADYRNDDPAHDQLARALAEGFIFQGQTGPATGRQRGEASRHLPPTAFVFFMQNHDQIGNRITGDRIDNIAPGKAVDAFVTVCLLSPQIPMLFMGEEFRATTPFPFFADMPEELREPTLLGRREELKLTTEHDDPTKPSVEETPDPSDPATFRSARLDWAEVRRPEGARVLALYRSLLAVRHREIVPRLHGIAGAGATAQSFGPNAVAVRWCMGDGARLCLWLNMTDAPVSCPPPDGRTLWQTGTFDSDRLGPWTALWTLAD